MRRAEQSSRILAKLSSPASRLVEEQRVTLAKLTSAKPLNQKMVVSLVLAVVLQRQLDRALQHSTARKVLI